MRSAKPALEVGFDVADAMQAIPPTVVGQPEPMIHDGQSNAGFRRPAL